MSVPVFHDDPVRPSVALELRSAVPVETLWATVSEPAGLATWFPAEMTFAPESGAPIVFSQGDWETSGTVLVFDPMRQFSFDWNGDELTFDVEAAEDGSKLTLTHRFSDRAGAASFATGWEACLMFLDAHLAGAEPPAPGRRIARHEELVERFGLDQPTVSRGEHGWNVRWERQMVAPAGALWTAFFGTGTDGAPNRPPASGESFHAPSAPEVVLGDVIEIEPETRILFKTADGQPGDLVSFRLGEGTGHGARLELDVSGTDPDEIDAAIDEWGAGAIAHLARETAR